MAQRTFIGTFHAFCAQILRQHGSHIGMAPDFAIFDQEPDRMAVLSDALAAAAKRGESVSQEDVRWLKTIDQLKARLGRHYDEPTVVRSITRLGGIACRSSPAHA